MVEPKPQEQITIALRHIQQGVDAMVSTLSLIAKCDPGPEEDQKLAIAHLRGLAASTLKLVRSLGLTRATDGSTRGRVSHQFVAGYEGFIDPVTGEQLWRHPADVPPLPADGGGEKDESNG